MSIHMTGELTVHDLDDLRLRYRWILGELIIIGFDLHVSDEEYEIAAAIISRETNTLVVWQNSVGIKRFIRPHDEVYCKPDPIREEEIRKAFPVYH